MLQDGGSQGHPGAAVHRATVLKGSRGTDLRSLGSHPASPVTGTLCGLSVPQQVRGHFLGDLPLSPWDSLVEDGEVESPAQAADDPVVGHAHGEVVVVVLGEGDGVRTRVGAGVLQEELQGDVELALAVLHDGQVRQVRLEKPVQGLQLIGVQQAIVDGSGATRECKGTGGDSVGLVRPGGARKAREGLFPHLGLARVGMWCPQGPVLGAWSRGQEVALRRRSLVEGRWASCPQKRSGRFSWALVCSTERVISLTLSLILSQLTT